ncbi:MAG: hypothetical protein ACXVQR_06285 [Solirubrobacteraceae bacterium]
MLALTLGACGHKEAHPHYADTEGVYVDAGPITYQVQLSRELNPYNVEDQEYLRGLPRGTTAPRPDQEWFGVFLWATNQSGRTAATADPTAFDIIDTRGTIYQPILLDPIANPFAWISRVLRPNGTQPSPESIAFYGPTQGDLLLFKINTSAYSNRPLLLRIHGPGRQVRATVSLDL